MQHARTARHLYNGVMRRFQHVTFSNAAVEWRRMSVGGVVLLQRVGGARRHQLQAASCRWRSLGAAARSQRGTIFFDTGLWFYSGLDMTLGHASVEESHHRLQFKLQT